MAPAGFYIGALLALAAGGLIVVFGIAGLAVLVIGPTRQNALTAPMVAAGLAGLTAMFFGSGLRIDAGFVVGVTALSAVTVTVFQRLREAPRNTTAWLAGFVGGQACVGAAQGLVCGVAAAVVGHDTRLLWILIPAGAAIRGAWAFRGRDRGAALAAEPTSSPVVTPAVPIDSVAAGTGVPPSIEPAVESKPVVNVELPAMVEPAADTGSPRVEATGAPIGMPLKLLGGGVVLLFALAAVAFLSVPSGPDDTHVTVFNRTESPVRFKSLFETGQAFVPPCTTVVFETSGQVWVAQSPAPAGDPVPADAVEVDVDRLIPRGADAPPPPEWEVLIASDREVGSSPGTWSAATPPCAGPARTPIELSGTGSTTTAPFRLAGAYRRSVVVTAPPAGRCSFAATMAGGEAQETIVEPFEAAPGTQPRFPANATYADGTYELSVTSSCSWSVSFAP